MDKVYDDLLEFSNNRELKNATIALPFVRDVMSSLAAKTNMVDEYYVHGMIMARILSDMSLPISGEELDKLLTSAICHIIMEVDPEYDINRNLIEREISEDIINFVLTMVEADKNNSNINVLDDRLLFIIKIVERCNLIEHLCDMSTEEAKAFIHETKRKLLPLCISAKEKYPEFNIQIDVLMVKMRTLIQVMDILYARYDAEQEELYDEILNYKDENFRIKKMLGKLA